jgi:ATP-dependent Lon protease
MAQTTRDDVEKTLLESLPAELPILPLRNTVALPHIVLPLLVGTPRSVRLIEDVAGEHRLIGLVTVKEDVEDPMPGQLYETGTIGLVHRVVRGEDGNLQVIVQGLERFKIDFWTRVEPYLKARIELQPDVADTSVETEALQRSLVQAAQSVLAMMPNVPAEIGQFLDRVQDTSQLVYMIASNSRLEPAQVQALLEASSMKEKMDMLLAHLNHEREVLSLTQKIAENAQEEMGKQQREYLLRQQLEAIRRELGESDEQGAEAQQYREKIEAAGLPEEAKEQAMRELSRLEKMPPQAAEYSVIKTYLDWLVDLPWSKLSDDNLDIAHARQVLDEDHYDLQEVKDRIVEFLAVRKMLQERKGETPEEGKPHEAEGMGAILCFVGPPGVGKTSLGRSIARALGREFTRMSLGGMRDEAEIRGHRRTYIGAMPGRVIQAIKRTGTRNPVFMLDEVDKIGADWRGDPASALLEVLDPQQNNTFRDHYLDVDFDLSDVMFVTTANQLDPIPEPLRDRMEIIMLDGYTEYEKLHIAQQFLIPRQLKVNGLRPDELSFDEAGIRTLIRDYTREAGVRNLEREIGSVCRKVVVQIAAGEAQTTVVTPDDVHRFLGKPRYFFDATERLEIPGIATGLAWTPVGGDVLFVEATQMRGNGHLTLTGQLGDVMKESAQIAFSYVQAKAKDYGIDPESFEHTNLHIHVPAGAVPKDGPSAGVTMATAIVSRLTNRAVRSEVGMTGEVTLLGRVMPIGGLKMKILAAHRAGLKTIILPKRNEMDLDDLPDDVRNEMNFVLVEQIDQVLDAALLPPGDVDSIPPAEAIPAGETEPVPLGEAVKSGVIPSQPPLPGNGHRDGQTS